MIWYIYTLIAIYLAYLLFVKPQFYWKRRNVKQTFGVPLLGDNLKAFFRLESFSELIIRLYSTFPKERYFGAYQMTSRALMVRDPELIKQITVKDFDHFMDHRSFVPENADQYWGKNLFALKGEQWKDMRATLSPSFTATKMRAMFTLMDEIARQFTDFYMESESNVITLEMKDSFTRFANDVIANCAFGIKCDSLKERENEFYIQGKIATDFSGLMRNLKFFIYALSPKIATFFQFKLFDKETTDFFTNIVTNTIQLREKHNINRPDMINLLMEARKGRLLHHEDDANATDTGFATVTESEIGLASKPQQKHELTDVDITAQALIFFFAGFDTVSTLMTFVVYELALNPDIQDKLRNEVDETTADCDGKLNYNCLAQMKYMDMVLSETLRKWPSAVLTDRLCSKSYTIQPTRPEESPVHIKKGEVVWVPVIGIHRDPEHYPEPERFDPERFNEDNKHNIKPYTYMPFGVGPRNCIGSRFALMETKTALYYILTKFEIVPVEKTRIPIKINRKTFNLSAAGGAWLGLKKRQF